MEEITETSGLDHAFIKSGKAGYSQEERNNLRFHLAMYAAATAIGRPTYLPKEVAEVQPDRMDDATYTSCAADVVQEFRRRQDGSNAVADRVAKSQAFATDIKRKLSERLKEGRT